MDNEHATQRAIAELALALEGTDVAMFTTRNAQGRLVSRPLAVRHIPFDGSVWFLTALGSKKLHELEADPYVNLAYLNTSNGSYLSLEGRANVSVDRARIALLWSDAVDAVFFPAGKEDPDLAAIRVEIDTAELWTSAATSLGRAFNHVKAALTGDSAALGLQKHFDLRNGLRTEQGR